MPNSHQLTFLVLVLFLLFSGCSSLNQNKKREEIAVKKKNYAALFLALSSNQLKRGVSSTEIREEFGEPENIFHSGTPSGAFSVWTYEKVLDVDIPEKWQVIRLYFDQEKLIDWKY